MYWMIDNNNSIYAGPRNVMDISDCYFYHTIDLPAHGTIAGDWDLRSDMKHYLGNVSFKGKKVLDIGAANGVLSFWMEDHSADVISFDLDSGGEWDLVPYAKWKEYNEMLEFRQKEIEKLKNAYWYAHRIKKSSAKVAYGNVYNMPKEIGPVDISVFGCILLHLKNPFLALQNGLQLTKETAIIVEPYRSPLQSNLPAQVFLPDAKEYKIFDAWWYLNPEVIVKMLGVLGFEETTVNYHNALFKGQKERLYTVVGRRTTSL